MTKYPLSNLPHSIKQRLLNFSQRELEDPNHTFTRFAIERFLYRLGNSKHAEKFVLKGAMLFAVWSRRPHRPTKDLDLLGYGHWTQEALKDIITDICQTQVPPDGLTYDVESIRVSDIREDQDYLGNRVELVARLGKSPIKIQVDIGLGDAVIPRPTKIVYPTLLDMPAPTILAYSHEVVIAEKLHAMVVRGITNSRMKDYFDIYILMQQFVFDGERLTDAIKATFSRRGTLIPADAPIAITDLFSDRPEKIVQWNAFLRRSRLANTPLALGDIVNALREFLLPVLTAIANNKSFTAQWNYSEKWT